MTCVFPKYYLWISWVKKPIFFGSKTKIEEIQQLKLKIEIDRFELDELCKTIEK